MSGLEAVSAQAGCWAARIASVRMRLARATRARRRPGTGTPAQSGSGWGPPTIARTVWTKRCIRSNVCGPIGKEVHIGWSR